jgi:hypothetical protein
VGCSLLLGGTFFWRKAIVSMMHNSLTQPQTPMKIVRSINVPIRQNLAWHEKWEGEDKGVIACWERGRQKAKEAPDSAINAIEGQLVVLPWKGGVEKAIKKSEKFGTYYYLAMWLGLRGDDLDVDTSVETSRTCTVTGMKVIYTADYKKYKEA